MKKYIIIPFIIILLLNSCSSSNRIYVNNDPFKNQSTAKLNQTLKGYSDENRKRLSGLADYYVIFKHYFAENMNSQKTYILDIKLSTRVRAYDVEPRLYISYNGNNTLLEAEDNIIKMYQQSSSSTSSETSTNTSADPNNEGEEITETSTTYTTTDSHDTFQLMQLRFTPDIELMKQLVNSQDVMFRLYIENESIDIPLKNKYKRKLKKYMELI